ncbi:hypothetical protein Bbelb_327740 [Branchiostoma belcheri]|nr:hypothetical protein Bbelb_327740 [Branchiostoma belcheri]
MSDTSAPGHFGIWTVRHLYTSAPAQCDTWTVRHQAQDGSALRRQNAAVGCLKLAGPRYDCQRRGNAWGCPGAKPSWRLGAEPSWVRCLTVLGKVPSRFGPGAEPS